MKTTRTMTVLLPLVLILLLRCGVAVGSCSKCYSVSKKATCTNTAKLGTGNWKIKDIYEHLKVNGDKMPPEEAKAYAKFIIDCQEPKTGNFIDSHGGCVYSLKAYHLVPFLKS